MAKYVMSDLHGCYTKFLQMLAYIDFTDEDELYICGDFIDRGENSLELYEHIRNSKNIHTVLGNHEAMYLEAYEEGDYHIWHRNGGHKTHQQLIERGFFFEEEFYKYLRKLPLYIIVDNYVIVHAGLRVEKEGSKLLVSELAHWYGRENMLWSRSLIGNEKKHSKYTIICGHSPTQYINGKTKIHNSNGTIYIDCGCFFDRGGKLACLCLDDLEEYYI